MWVRKTHQEHAAETLVLYSQAVSWGQLQEEGDSRAEAMDATHSVGAFSPLFPGPGGWTEPALDFP